jgi:hypothetical protein
MKPRSVIASAGPRPSGARRALYLALAFGLLGVAAPAAKAAALSEKAVRTAVETWVRQVTADARADAVVERMEAHATSGRAFAYVAQLAGTGYCLCGGDDQLLPVYLYCPRGQYDPNNPNNQFVFEEIRLRLEALEKARAEKDPALEALGPELSRRLSYWQDLIAGKAPPPDGPKGGEPASMVLPLTSLWHQGSPYNDNCPNLTPGQDEHTIVGCVATAMSQAMYYWKWPRAGTGSVPTPFPYKYRYSTTWLAEPLSSDPQIPTSWSSRLVWSSASGGTLSMTGYWDEECVYYQSQKLCINAAKAAYLTALSALWSRMTQAQFVPNVNFATPINWAAIQDQHADPVDDGDPAVAALCYEVGVSVYMHYGLWFSNAGDQHIAEALKLYFYYDPDAVHQTADAAKIIEDIQWYRVAELGGGGPPPIPGGHSWLAFGYNMNVNPTQFLMNLGWNGQAPVWYSLDQVFPTNQTMTIRMAPQGAVQFVGSTTSGDGSPSNPHLGIEEALTRVPDGTTLVFKAGSDNTFATGPLTISRPLTLKGVDATIRKR